jgi:hypothetical protein
MRTIYSLMKRITKTQKTDNTFTTSNTQKKIWITFTYHSPLIHKITNLFKHTSLNIPFRTGNTIYNWLQDGKPQNITNSSGVYRLQCKTCNKSYVGQTEGTINIRHREHTRYKRTKNTGSAYEFHILNNKHKYGSTQHTIHLMRACDKGKLMKC